MKDYPPGERLAEMGFYISKPGEIEVQLTRPADAHPLSLILARAFHHDPVQSWLFPDDKKRDRKSQYIFSVFLHSLIPCGTVYTTPGLEGAALWMDPRQVRSGVLQQIKLGIKILPVLGASILQGIRYQLKVESKQPNYPHYYLCVLGVAPDHQGKGIGSALLQPVLRKCDAERLPAYLETGKEGNVPFYQRQGFEVIEKIRLPDGPTVYRMIREPSPGI